MNATPSKSRIARRRSRGMTLIELMIAVAIVAILAAVAIPAYQESVRKGRRAEAFKLLAAAQQAQERWRGVNAEYATDLSSAPPNGLGLAASSPSGYYVISIASAAAGSYELRATAQAAQTADERCKLMGIRVIGGNVAQGSGTNAVDWSDPGRCWAK